VLPRAQVQQAASSLEKVACGAFSDGAQYPPAKGVTLAGCRVAAGAGPTGC
jgi:hypothetical protein